MDFYQRDERIDIWGDGTVARDFIFVEDVLDGLEAAARYQGDERIFNIGSGLGRTVREVIAVVAGLVDKKLPIGWQAKRAFDVPVSMVSTERARNVLGWSPKTPFEKGLELTVSWWRSQLSSNIDGRNVLPRLTPGGRPGQDASARTQRFQ